MDPQCIRLKSHTTPWTHACPTEYPFQTIGVDFVGELPTSTNGNKSILTAVFLHSDFLMVIPVPNKKATTTACAFLDQLFLQYGFPTQLQSDRGGEWLNLVRSHDTKLISMNHVFTTSYGPRLNGLTKRVHRLLNSAIGVCPQHYPNNIDPFFLVFGRHAETLTFDLPPVPFQRTCMVIILSIV